MLRIRLAPGNLTSNLGTTGAATSLVVSAPQVGAGIGLASST